MNFIVSIIVTIIILILLAVTGGYATAAATATTFITGYDTNEKLKSAHTKLTWAAVITWIVVGLIVIVGIVLLINIKSEKVNALSNIIIYLFIGLSVIAIGLVGILSSIAASELSGTPNDQGAHTKATIAAILGIISFVGIIVIMILTIVYRPKGTSPQTQTYYQAPPQTRTQAAPPSQSQQAAPPPTQKAEQPKSEYRPEPSGPGCPSANVDPSSLECDRKNYRIVHPDRNPDCEKSSNAKFIQYRERCG